MTTLLRWGFPSGSAGKESVCNEGVLGSIPGLGRSPEEGKGYPLQYSGLKNSMDCIAHGITKSWKKLSSFSLLQGIFLTQESNQGLLRCRRILCQLSHQGCMVKINYLILSDSIESWY